MTTLTVSTKEVADVAALFDYRKKKVNLYFRGSVTLCDLNWHGGTKSEYHAVDLNTMQISSPKLDGPAPWENRVEGMTIQIPTNFIIVRTGHFCGKPAVMTIYARPENMGRFIT